MNGGDVDEDATGREERDDRSAEIWRKSSCRIASRELAGAKIPGSKAAAAAGEIGFHRDAGALVEGAVNGRGTEVDGEG